MIKEWCKIMIPQFLKNLDALKTNPFKPLASLGKNSVSAKRRLYVCGDLENQMA